MVISFLVLPLLLLAGGAMIATTVLGLAAIRDIRSSDGRIVGLPLALADAVLFPLLILDVLIVAGVLALCSAIQELAPKEALLLSLPLCLIVDALLIRWAWRSLSTTAVPPRDDQWALPHQPMPPAKLTAEANGEVDRSGTGSRIPAVLLVAALLVGAAATIGIYSGGGPRSVHRLIAAVTGRDGATTERLLDSQPEWLEERDAEGLTPLSLAALRGDTALVHRLLQRGPEIDSVDIHGETPLIKAAESGHSGVVSALLFAGAGVEHSTATGENALTLAAAGGHLRIVRELVEHGADLNHATSTGQTALSQAVGGGHAATVEFLLAQGADAAHLDPAGRSLLHYAATDSLYQRLLDAGAPVGRPEMFREGYKLAVAGRYADAAEKFEQALQNQAAKRGPIQANLYGWTYEIPDPELTLPVLLADCYAHTEDTEKASQVLTRGELPWPDAPSALLYRRHQEIPELQVSERYELTREELDRFQQSPAQPLSLRVDRQEVREQRVGDPFHRRSTHGETSTSGAFQY